MNSSRTMPSLPAWRTLLRLLDDPHQAGFPPEQLRQLPGGRELLASDSLMRFDAPYLTVARGPYQESVEYFPGKDDRTICYRCPETGRTVIADRQEVARYAASRSRIGTMLQEQLGISSAIREWAPSLLWIGDVAFNERLSSVFFIPNFDHETEALLATLGQRVVRTPAIAFTAGSRKTPFCWSGGWGIALPIDQCLHEDGGPGAVLDHALVAMEIRQPHRDIARRLVDFDFKSHILRIEGLGSFSIAKGEAAAVVRRLVEAVWVGEAMVSLSELRKAAGAGNAKSFKDMMGRTNDWKRFIWHPAQGYYAPRLVAD